MISAFFNSDYYLTIATVIPILMIGITWASFTGLRLDLLVERILNKDRAGKVLLGCLSVAVVVPFFIAVVAEFDVLCAIRDHANMSKTGVKWVQGVTLILLILVGIGCAISVLKGLIDDADD